MMMNIDDEEEEPVSDKQLRRTNIENGSKVETSYQRIIIMNENKDKNIYHKKKKFLDLISRFKPSIRRESVSASTATCRI